MNNWEIAGLIAYGLIQFLAFAMCRLEYLMSKKNGDGTDGIVPITIFSLVPGFNIFFAGVFCYEIYKLLKDREDV